MAQLKALQFPEHVYTKDISYEAGAPPNGSFRDEGFGPNVSVIDNALVESLERLITGRIASWADVELAETATRALVLHEMVYWIHPSVLVVEPVPVHGGEGKILAKESGRIVGPDYLKDYGVSEQFRKNGIHLYQAWNDGVFAKDGKIIHGSDFWQGIGNIPSESDDQALKEIFAQQLQIPYYKNKYLMSAKALGAGAYFGNESDREYEAALSREISPKAPQKLLSKMDETWANEVAGGDFGLNIRLGPFLAIALSRAENRDQILDRIYELRHEFSSSRKELWELFSSVLSEKRMAVMLRDARKLDSAIKSIVPAAFPRKTNPFGLLWQSVYALKDIVESGGIFSGVKLMGEVLLSRDVNWTQASAVRATKDLAKSLKDIDESLPALLVKHLSKDELGRLGL